MDVLAHKRCGRCGETLPREAFHRHSGRADGLQAQCRACRRTAQANWYARHGHAQRSRNDQRRVRNARLLWEYLAEHTCIDCGEPDPIVPEFDHLRGEKTRTLSDMAWRGYSEEMLRTEIAKCEVRCANCHRRRTAEQQGWYAAIVRR